MRRLAVMLALAAMFVASTSAIVDAQRGGGGGARGGSVGRGGGGGGRGGAIGRGVDGARSGGFRSDGFRSDGFRGDGFRSDGVRGDRFRDGGFRFQGRVNVPRRSISRLGDLSSINRPFGADINGIQTTPPPGFGPRRPSPFRARPGTYTRIHPVTLSAPFGYDYGYGSGYGYDVPPYGPPYTELSTYEKMYQVAEPENTTGTLFLDVVPASASVFIDTAYVGSVGDLQARGLTLSEGRHYLALEAPGYDRRTTEVAINADEPLRYRYEMTPEQRVAAPILPPRPPQTMYMIPGCYGGNRPPVAANLPRGCDISRMRVLRPQPRAN